MTEFLEEARVINEIDKYSNLVNFLCVLLITLLALPNVAHSSEVILQTKKIFGSKFLLCFGEYLKTNQELNIQKPNLDINLLNKSFLYFLVKGHEDNLLKKNLGFSDSKLKTQYLFQLIKTQHIKDVEVLKKEINLHQFSGYYYINSNVKKVKINNFVTLLVILICCGLINAFLSHLRLRAKEMTRQQIIEETKEFIKSLPAHLRRKYASLLAFLLKLVNSNRGIVNICCILTVCIMFLFGLVQLKDIAFKISKGKEKEYIPANDVDVLKKILREMDISFDILNFKWLAILKESSAFLEKIEILLKNATTIKNIEILSNFVAKNTKLVYSLLKNIDIGLLIVTTLANPEYDKNFKNLLIKVLNANKNNILPTRQELENLKFNILDALSEAFELEKYLF